ncbi:unnamed protein product, partial [marine sediment metagenome]
IKYQNIASGASFCSIKSSVCPALLALALLFFSKNNHVYK